MALGFRWSAVVVLASGSLATPALSAEQGNAPRMDIRLGITTRYETNVGRGNSQTGAMRGIEPHDVKISPSLALDISRPIGSSTVTLSGSAGYDIYRRNDQLNRENVNLTAGASSRLGPCNLSLGSGISRRQTELADLTLQNLGISGTAKNAETTLNASASTVCGGTYGLRPLAAISYARGRNSSILRAPGERNTLSYQAGIGYSTPAIGEVRLVGSISEVEFPKRPQIGGRKDGYDVTSLTLEYSRDIGAQTRASAHIGYTRVNPSNALAGNFRGTTWGADISTTLGGRMKISGQFSRDINNNLGSNSTFTVTNIYGVNAEFAVNDRLRLRARGQLTKQDYRYSTPPVGVFLDKERRRTIDVGANYMLSRRITMSLSGGTERRTAAGTLFDYSNRFISLGLSTSL